MDLNSIKIIGTAFAIGMGTIVPALAIGWIGSKSVDAIGRNPEAASKVQTMAILGNRVRGSHRHLRPRCRAYHQVCLVINEENVVDVSGRIVRS